MRPPLVEILRTWLSGASTSASVSPDLYDLARQHRLAGTLYHIGAALGDHDAHAAEAAWTLNLGSHLRRLELLRSLWPSWAAPPLLFKGADLSEVLYKDPGARRAIDLDLLTPPHQHRALCAHFSKLADQVILPQHERLPGEPHFSVGYRVQHLLIELHRDPMPRHRARLHGADVWRRATLINLDGMTIKRPTPTDRALLWLANQSKAAFSGDLQDLLDWCLILRQWPEQPPAQAIQRAADHAGLTRSLRLAMLRLRISGLWPTHAPTAHDRTTRCLNQLLPDPRSPRANPPRVNAHLVRLWLATASGRGAMGLRALTFQHLQGHRDAS